MAVKKVILDFDGTLTDIEQEAIPAVENWKEEVRKYLGLDSQNIVARWQEIGDRIISSPTKYGWTNQGKIIAPAYADPFVMSTTISEILLNEERPHMNSVEREAVLRGFFSSSYSKSGIAFKPGTDNFLSELKKSFEVVIVTNSGTDKVSSKIKNLSDNHKDIAIYGNAKKYALSPDWVEVPESISKEGFERPLFLRRKDYGKVLESIVSAASNSSEEIAVVGDIYELDLLLPEYLGMNTILMPRKNTPSFETNAVTLSPRGHIFESYSGLIDCLKKLS